VYLEFEEVPFEAASSMGLSEKGPTRISIRIPNGWAYKLSLIQSLNATEPE
jgi:hypothetical protein